MNQPVPSQGETLESIMGQLDESAAQQPPTPNLMNLSTTSTTSPGATESKRSKSKKKKATKSDASQISSQQEEAPSQEEQPCNIPTTTLGMDELDMESSSAIPPLHQHLHAKQLSFNSEPESKKHPRSAPSRPSVPLPPGEYESFVNSIKGKIVKPKTVCTNCGIDSTPTWRKGPLGMGTLCNACGIKFSTAALQLDANTGAREGYKGFYQFEDDTSIIPSPTMSLVEGSGMAENVEMKGSLTPETKRRGRPKGSVKKKQQPNTPARSSVSENVLSPEASPSVLPKKRGRGRPPKIKSAPLSTAPVLSLPVDQPLLDLNSVPTFEQLGSSLMEESFVTGKRKRKPLVVTTDSDSDYLSQQEEEIEMTQEVVTNGNSIVEPKKRKLIVMPVASEQQMAALAKELRDPTSVDSITYISSDYLKKCMEGYQFLLKQREHNNGFINRILTKDTLAYIFLFLEETDVYSTMATCRYWADVSKSDIIWKNIYKNRWGIDEESLARYTKSILARAPSLNWYELVQARINIRICSPIQQIDFMAKFYAIENKPKILACIQQNLNEEINERNNLRE